MAISSYFNHYDLESLEEAEGELQDVSTEVQDLAKLNEHIKMEETELREITSYMFTYNQNNISFVISLDFTQIPEENIDDVMADLGIMQDEGPYDYIDNDYGDDDFDDYDHSDFDFDWSLQKLYLKNDFLWAFKCKSLNNLCNFVVL